MQYVLETNALTKRYKNFTALNGLTMHIPKGSIYGFVGRNGAGKTTLIRLICGLQEPDSGIYRIYGIKNTDPQIVRSRRRMGAVVEIPSIYLDMNARDVDMVYDLRIKNSIYYQYHPPLVTRESILEDMDALPPGKTLNDKYYIGFFKRDKLIAVMELVMNYPKKKTAFIIMGIITIFIDNRMIAVYNLY